MKMEMNDSESKEDSVKFVQRKKLHLDEVFTKYIGEGGRYQLFVVVILAVNGFCTAGCFLDILWVADPQPHWCSLPDEANPDLKNISLQERLNLSIPWIEKGGEMVRDSCNMYNLNYSTLIPLDGFHLRNGNRSRSTTSTVSCSQWEFDTSEFRGTIVEKWNMVCDRRILIATSQSVTLAANPVGAIVGGALADRFGRRRMLTFFTVVPIGFRLLQIFAPTLPIYMMSTFIVAACYMGAYIASFALGVELVGPKYRYVMGVLSPTMWALGSIVNTGIAYLIRERVTLQLVLSIPLLYFFTYICFIPESPRWLIAKGRITRANKILHKFAAKNNSSYPEEEVDIALEEDTKFRITTVFTSKRLIFRSAILALGWWAVNFVYIGLTMNVTNISGSLYLNQLILYSVEIPSNLITMKLVGTKLGRRWTVGAIIFISGLSLLSVAAIPKERETLILVLVTISKGLSAGGFTGIYVFTAEMYPSEMRTAAISTLNSSGKLIAMLTPFIAYLAIYSQNLPLIIFGTLPTLAGPLFLLLPETNGEPLPQTIKEVEEMKTQCWGSKAEET